MADSRTNSSDTQLHLRPARVDDYPAICALVSSRAELFRVFPGRRWPFGPRQLHRIADQRSDLTVVLDRSGPVAFANLYGIVPGKHAFIGNLIVRADRRGRGIGRQLVLHMLELVRHRHGLPEARLAVFEDNLPARALYRQLGFEPCATSSRRAPDGRKVVLLELRKALFGCQSPSPSVPLPKGEG